MCFLIKRRKLTHIKNSDDYKLDDRENENSIDEFIFQCNEHKQHFDNDFEESFSEFDPSDSENEKTYNHLENEHIFTGSSIKVSDFALSFLILCKRIKITSKAKNILLEYISTILPINNKIPSSYTKLISYFTLNAVKKTKICDNCYLEVCTCESKNELSIFEFDVGYQLRSIVRKNFETICNYKGRCATKLNSKIT